MCAAVWRCLLACSRTHCPLSLFCFLPLSSVAFPSPFRLLACACTRTQVRTGAGTQPRRRPRTPVPRCEPEREAKHARAKTRTTEETFRSVRGARTYIPVCTYVCTYLSPTMHVGNANRRIHVRYGPVRVYICTAKAR